MPIKSESLAVEPSHKLFCFVLILQVTPMCNQFGNKCQRVTLLKCGCAYKTSPLSQPSHLMESPSIWHGCRGYKILGKNPRHAWEGPVPSFSLIQRNAGSAWSRLPYSWRCQRLSSENGTQSHATSSLFHTGYVIPKHRGQLSWKLSLLNILQEHTEDTEFLE